jgi:hypothetical protein
MAPHALANTANTATVGGLVGAQIAAPVALVAVNMLQFGSLAQPQTGGTIVMSPQGTISTTGDLGQASSIAQSGPRGAASFRLTGNPGTNFAIYGVASVTISNGSARMTVGQFTTDAYFATGQIGATGSAGFNIGGTLTATANQARGTYSGTFPIIVQYY